MRKTLMALWVLWIGCAHDVRIKVPGHDPKIVGTIEVVFTRHAADVAVVVDGALLVRGADTSRIVITGVPAGIVELMVAAGSGAGRVERFVRVDVDIGKTTTIPIAAPDKSMMADMPTTLLMVVVGVLLRIAYLEWL